MKINLKTSISVHKSNSKVYKTMCNSSGSSKRSSNTEHKPFYSSRDAHYNKAKMVLRYFEKLICLSR